MSCFLENKGGNTTAVLVFKRSQLLYDIRNYAHIEGGMIDTASDHSRHMVQDVGEEGNVDRVTRVLDMSIAKCREMLYQYTKHELQNPGLDNVLKEPGAYGIVLNVPFDFSQTTLNLLEKLIHEYLVCKAVEDWMSITNPNKAQIWEAKAENAEREILRNMHNRRASMRRRLHPF